MKARIAAWLCLFLFQGGLAAQADPLAPTGFPPAVGIGKAIMNDGKATIELTVASLVQVTEETVVERDGKKGIEVKKRYNTVMITGSFFVHEKDAITLAKDGKTVEKVVIPPLQGIGVFSRNGQAVARKDLPKLFENPRPVLVFGGKKLDPYYLQVVRDDTLIITGAGDFVFPGEEHELDDK